MGDIDSQVAIDTRFIGEAAASRGQADLARMVFRFFNSYLRAAIDRGSARTADDVLLQYRLLIEEVLRRGLCDVACEGAGFIKYFGRVAFEEELPSITETVAYDLASLCQSAHEDRLDCEKLMLQQLLSLDDQESSRSHRQQRGLRGVRLSQTKLAVYYLAVGDEAKARMVADDMCEMPASVKASIRAELAEETPPHFWEVVDRGRNLHYLTAPERAKLDTFLDWLAESRA
jgi:hypothetical protein